MELEKSTKVAKLNAEALAEKLAELKKTVYELEEARQRASEQIQMAGQEIRELEKVQRELWQKEKDVHDKIKSLESSIKTDILEMNYHWGLKMASILYLKEHYLAILENRAAYDGNKPRGEQMRYIHERQDIIARIGMCLNIFTKRILTSPINATRIKEKAMKTKTVHPIWNLAHWWELNDYKLLSKETVEPIFDKLIASTGSTDKIPQCKELLNTAYNVLYQEKVW